MGTAYHNPNIPQKEKDLYRPYGPNRREVDSIISGICMEEIMGLPRDWKPSRFLMYYHRIKFFVSNFLHRAKKKSSKLENSV